jgi:hypothetical protein
MENYSINICGTIKPNIEALEAIFKVEGFLPQRLYTAKNIKFSLN